MTTQRFWAAVAGIVLGVATFAGGPSALVGNGIPAAEAQSASSLVANVMGLLNAPSTPENQAKLNAAIAAAVAAGGPGIVASMVVTAGVGGGGAANVALAAKMTNAVLAVAATNPAIQVAVGQGMAAAASTFTSSNNSSLALGVQQSVAANGNPTIIQAYATAPPIVPPSPQQTCTAGSCS